MPRLERRRTLVEQAIRAVEAGEKIAALKALHSLLRFSLDRTRRRPRAYARPRVKCPRCTREVAMCADGTPHAHHRFDTGEPCFAKGGAR